MEGNEEENNEQNQINHEELDAQGKFNIQHSQENLAMQNQQQQATQSSGDDMHAQQFDHQDQDYEIKIMSLKKKSKSMKTNNNKNMMKNKSRSN